MSLWVERQVLVQSFFILILWVTTTNTFQGSNMQRDNRINPGEFPQVIRKTALSETKQEIVELQRSIKPKSPEQELRELSEAALEYGIQEKDVYGSGAKWLDSFEAEVAELLGKEAAMFCPSGVMAQQIALLVHLNTSQPERKAFVCHPTSHLLLWEENAYQELLGFQALASKTKHETMSPEDLSGILKEVSANQAFPSSAILEIPYRELGGVCTPFEDILKIREICSKNGLKLHMDGARMWEAQPHYGMSFKELAAPFDSVYVSFYKGLGGLTGAMLIGDSDFIQKSRIWLRRFGGNVFTSLPYALSALKGYKTNMGTFENKRHKMRSVVSAITKLAQAKGLQESIKFFPEEPHCNMVHCHLAWPEEKVMEKVQAIADATGTKVITRLRKGTPSSCYFEWSIGELNYNLDDAKICLGFENLLDELSRQIGPQL